MPLKPQPKHDRDSISHEKEPVHTLSEALRSFEGTPAEALIIGALEREGIDPQKYAPGDYLTQHNSYIGLPATTPDVNEPDQPSPILSVIYEKLEDGSIVEDPVHVLEKSVRVKADSLNPSLSRLHLIDTSILRDAETGEAIAVTTGLSAEAGREGHVICSVNDLEIVDK